MLFNSFGFLIFFPIVCMIYYALRNNKYRNPFLLLASYFFYMNWEPVYAVLILSSTIITFFGSLIIENIARKKLALTVTLILNLSILFIFKYYNFVNETVWDMMNFFGIRWDVPNLDILLPVGISFYTFQAIGYTVDVYRGTIKAERNFGTYALFLSFFPQLVAGPIERAKNLMPQFHTEHEFRYENISEGFKQMLWGFFMKLCIADRLGEYVDAVYGNIDRHNGTTLVIATIFFTFQIYCDFGGYSNIAIGAAKVMGFKLMENFRRPYFSISVREFWKRWHISLSSWFMDYVYISLGGNRVKYLRNLFNILITFIISGLWHGANWTFVAWGAIHGSYLIVYNLFCKYIYRPTYKSAISKILNIILCFILVAFAWIFFRANNIEDAFTIIRRMIIFQGAGDIFQNTIIFIYSFISLSILIFKDLKDELGWKINFMHSRYPAIRYISALFLIGYIMQMGVMNGGQFIYFQF